MFPERFQARVITGAEPLESPRVIDTGLDAGLQEASVLPPVPALQDLASQLGTDGSSTFTALGAAGRGEVTTHLSPEEFRAFLADGGVLRARHGSVVASLDAGADSSAPFIVEYNLGPGVNYHTEGDHFLLDGSVRDGRHMSVTYAGPNPAASELPVDWLQGVHDTPGSAEAPSETPATQAEKPRLSAVASAIRDGLTNRDARKIPSELWPEVRRKLELLEQVKDFRELGNQGGVGGNNLEKLKGKLAGQWSIRVNKQYRIVFTVKDGRPTDVDVLDYHG